AYQRGRLISFALSDELHLLRELTEPRVDRGAHLADIFPLRGVVADHSGALVEIGMDLRHRALMVAEELGTRGQEVTARRALGPADSEQQRIGLVLDLDSMHHPA